MVKRLLFKFVKISHKAISYKHAQDMVTGLRTNRPDIGIASRRGFKIFRFILMHHTSLATLRDDYTKTFLQKLYKLLKEIGIT